MYSGWQSSFVTSGGFSLACVTTKLLKIRHFLRLRLNPNVNYFCVKGSVGNFFFYRFGTKLQVCPTAVLGSKPALKILQDILEHFYTEICGEL